MKLFLLAGFAGALFVGVACGGNVVVDGNGGAGGTGSTTTNVSSSISNSSVTTASSMSTSSGTSCSCESFCSILQGCNFGGVECLSFCEDIGPETMLCACDSAPAGCDAVSQCFSSTGPSTTAGVGGSGGGSGTPTNECFECIDNPPGCAMAYDVCTSNPDCEAIILCHSDFNWTYEAISQCDPFYPNGYGDFSNLINCVVCQSSCFDPCASSSLVSYCFDG